MFEDKELARKVRDVFRGVSNLVLRAEELVRDSNCSPEERAAFMERLFLEFHSPLAGVIADTYVKHPDLVLNDEGHPDGYWEKQKARKEAKP